MATPSRDGGPGSLPLLAGALWCVFGGACAIEVPVGSDAIDRKPVASVPSTIRHDVDLLFVVDDRASMASLRSESALFWQKIRNHLAYAEGGFPSVHVGVVSADVGVGLGAGKPTVPGCSVSGGDGALVAGADGTRWLDVDGDNQDVSDYLLAARLDLPDAGCPYDQPVLAMERALDGEQAANDGFRRPDAALGVVFVAGDDDCSVDQPAFWGDLDGEPVDPFRCFREAVHCNGDDVYVGELGGCTAREDPLHLVDLADVHMFLDRIIDPQARFLTAIVGDTTHVDVVADGDSFALAPACSDPSRTLYPGLRLHDLVEPRPEEHVIEHGVAGGVCGESAAVVGTPAAFGLRGALGNRCLDHHLLDVRPDEPGIQPDCIVKANEDELPMCKNPSHVYDEAGPCWSIEDGMAECGDFPTQLALEVNWGGAQPHVQPPGVTAEVDCVLAPEGPPLE